MSKKKICVWNTKAYQFVMWVSCHLSLIFNSVIINKKIIETISKHHDGAFWPKTQSFMKTKDPDLLLIETLFKPSIYLSYSCGMTSITLCDILEQDVMFEGIKTGPR